MRLKDKMLKPKTKLMFFYGKTVYTCTCRP